MKTLNRILFFVFLSYMLLFVNTSTTQTSSNSLAQNQIKSEAVVNIMKGLLGRSKKPSRRSKQESTIPKSVEVVDRMKIQTEFEKLAVQIEGWIKVSSPEFKNIEKFPTITMADYKTKRMAIDINNFRINELYDETKSGPEFPPDETYFWFRLSDKNIYYTPNKSSLNILGNISVKRLAGISIDKKPLSTCFFLTDKDNNALTLCAESQELRHKWVCAIKGLLGERDPSCEKLGPTDSSVVIEDTKVSDPVILIPLPSKICNDGWTYDSLGKDWECDCSEGKNQSPIDIDTNKIFRSPVKPVFKYNEVEIKVKEDEDSPLKIEYTEGVIRIKYDSFGKVITLDGNVYSAQEIKFHTPSQHTIDGRHSDLEIEIIHVGESKEVIANHLIVSILFDAKPGVYNKFFDDIDFFNLPNPMFKKRDIRNNLNLNKLHYEIQSTDFPLWPQFSFYTYEGSLTAPPCSERTIHYVKSAPIPLGNTTLQLLREAIRVPDLMDDQGNVTINTKEPKNIRETQKLNGRRVYYYDYVMTNLLKGILPRKKENKGHYEKVAQKMTNFYHVNTDKPSGMPGAFLVSQNEAKGVEA